MKDIVLKIKMCDRKGEYTNSTFKDIILLASPDFLFNKKKKKVYSYIPFFCLDLEIFHLKKIVLILYFILVVNY